MGHLGRVLGAFPGACLLTERNLFLDSSFAGSRVRLKGHSC